MKKLPIQLWICLALLPFLTLLCSTGKKQGDSGYKVTIDGIEDKKLATLFLEATSTYNLRHTHITSLTHLRERANQDTEKLVDLAHYYGYYSAKVSYVFSSTPELNVHFHAILGPQYLLETLEIKAQDEDTHEVLKNLILPTLSLQKPITTKELLEYEKTLITLLKKNGYAGCAIRNKTFVADVKTHTLRVILTLQTGPKMFFGPLEIVGNKTVRLETVKKYIFWKEGDEYDPAKVAISEQALEKTGLFTSVVLSEDATLTDQVPMRLDVLESKHKSIGAGLSYTTTWGPGVMAEWENKNIRGTGDILSFRTEVWKRYQTATLSLVKPHAQNEDKDLIWLLQYNKLHTLPFDSRSYSLSCLSQKRTAEKVQFDMGLRLEWLKAKNFELHDIYYLVKLPLQLKVSSANTFLDPTSGQTLNVKFTPTTQLLPPYFVYGIHTTSLATYHSLPSNAFTLAAKIVVGNIFGAGRNTIPPPDRIYGGSENVLRGYRAFTVSPLHKDRIPIGGRSMLAASVEARFRMQNDFGWVLFYDVGNVFSTNMPKITTHQLQSLGGGIRYNTPIGPLRFDIAVPLDRRPHIDPHFQIFFSIGQAF